MPDGAFLTPVSGLHYVLNIFDQAAAVLDLLPATLEVQHGHVTESVRCHDDRIAYLEGSHGHLVKRVDSKAAVAAEFEDWVMNKSEEDWFTVQGLKRLQVDGEREWQLAARRQVNDLIKMVLKANRADLEYSILYVGNPLRYRKTGQTVYNVQMSSVYESRRIREMYSGFFRHGRPLQLPSALKGVSLRNKVTLATRVRKSILQQLGANYKASNPGATINVMGYGPRPRISIRPPRGSSGTSERPRTFNFVEAVTNLPSNLSDENLAKIFSILGHHHPGELRSIFVVLSDDDRERCEALAKSAPRFSKPSSASAAAPTLPSGSRAMSGAVSGPGTGMDVQAGFLASLRAPPPPPPPAPPSSAPSRSNSRSPSRSRKAGRDRRRSSSRSASRSPSRSRRRSVRSRSPSRPARSERSRRQRSTSGERSKRGLKRCHQSESKRRSRKTKRSRRAPSSSSGSSSGSSSD